MEGLVIVAGQKKKEVAGFGLQRNFVPDYGALAFLNIEKAIMPGDMRRYIPGGFTGVAPHVSDPDPEQGPGVVQLLPICGFGRRRFLFGRHVRFSANVSKRDLSSRVQSSPAVARAFLEGLIRDGDFLPVAFEISGFPVQPIHVHFRRIAGFIPMGL